MSDKTTLSTTSGGDIIATSETIDLSSGVAVSVKTQVVLLATRDAIVSDVAPLPIA